MPDRDVAVPVAEVAAGARRGGGGAPRQNRRRVGVEGVEGDAAGVGAGHQVLEVERQVVALGLEIGTDLDLVGDGIEPPGEPVEYRPGRAHRQAVADVDHRLAAAEPGRHADELADHPQRLAGVHHLLLGQAADPRQQGTRRAGHLEADLVLRLHLAAARGGGEETAAGLDVEVADVGQQLPALDVEPLADAGGLLDRLEGGEDVVRRGGEAVAVHRQGAAVGGHHHPQVVAPALEQELAQPRQDSGAVDLGDVRLVDEQDHVVQPLGDRRLGRLAGRARVPRARVPRTRIPHGRGTGGGVEVRDLDPLAVLEQLEVLGAEPGHRPALFVGDDDVDVDHVDVGGAGEDRLPGDVIVLLRRRRRRQQGEQQGQAREGDARPVMSEHRLSLTPQRLWWRPGYDPFRAREGGGLVARGARAAASRVRPGL